MYLGFRIYVFRVSGIYIYDFGYIYLKLWEYIFRISDIYI